MTLDKDTRDFWNAAHFYRRAPERDQRVAIYILNVLSRTSTDAIKARAAELLRKIDNDRTANHS